MRKEKKSIAAVLCLGAMTILILDAQCALNGAKDGIILCLYTVIPALFPFCILSIILRNLCSGSKLKLLFFIERICGMPFGSGIIFILGLLGGYPVGAICIEQLRKCNQISDQNATRMAIFCNNAGPAFIFGIVYSIFQSAATVLHIWLIIILSALITGYLLPYKSSFSIQQNAKVKFSLKNAVNDASRAMVQISCTIILFRTILSIVRKWVLLLLPKDAFIIFTGLIELTNGIIELNNIQSDTLRFILCVGMLSFGGLCVAFQTTSVSPSIKIVYYISGKLLQAIISIFLVFLYQTVLYNKFKALTVISFLLILCVFGALKIFFNKKTVAIIP